MKIKYTLGKLLNDDEHASLWQAKLCLDDEDKGHKVIVKSLKSMIHLDNSAEQLFRERASSFLHAKNTSLVHLFDFGLLQNNFYTTQEFVDGYSLQQILMSLSSKQLHLPLWFIIPVFLSIVQAIKTIHSNSMQLNNGHAEPIYRITPSKIFLSNRGAVKLIETGLFRPFINATDNEFKKKYQQPQSIEIERPDLSADIYSLGIILCECLTGKVPSQKYPLSEILSECNWIPKEIVSILDKSISANPSARFKKTEDFSWALSNYLKSYPQKNNNSEFMTLLAILFSDDKNIASTQKHIDNWLKKVEQTEPQRISWFYEFRHAFHHNDRKTAELIDDPMMRFVTIQSPKRTIDSTLTAINLQDNTDILKTAENKHIYNLSNRSDRAARTNTINVFNMNEQSKKTEDKIYDFNKSISVSDDLDSLPADMWVSTRTLRLSGLRLRMAAEQSENIFSKTRKPVKNPIKSETGNQYISTIADDKHKVIQGKDEFELGLEALQRRDYNMALHHFEAAYQSDPENKMFAANLKRIKTRMNN